jgi:hypothetical protein
LGSIPERQERGDDEAEQKRKLMEITAQLNKREICDGPLKTVGVGPHLHGLCALLCFCLPRFFTLGVQQRS